MTIMIHDNNYNDERRAAYCFLESAGEIDDGDVGDGYAERHSGEFAVECRDHLADGLGGPGRRRDDVRSGRATAAPVLLDTLSSHHWG